MLTFRCDRCEQLVFFENTECLRCGAPLGFAVDRRRVITLADLRDGSFEELANVVTGHSDGVVTLDLAESDDAHREQVRAELGEPYRTLLGHFRHETGHYYWQVLVGKPGPRRDAFRELFGDETADYGESLRRHYSDGPPPHWADNYVSAYATMHPWEDWAETFAHYLHVRDTLQTAAAFGVRVDGPGAADRPAPYRRQPVAVAADAGVAGGSFAGDGVVVDQWLPLTYALNAMNRSMGRDDLYPFVLTPAVVDKLTFVHDVVSGRR